MSIFNFWRNRTKPVSIVMEPDKGLDAEGRKKLCLELKASIDEALQRNTRYNKTSDGRILKAERPQTRSFRNGDKHTCLVFHPEDELLIGGGTRMQIDVGAYQLHLFNAPYGADVYKEISELPGFRMMLVQKAENLSRFG